MDERPNFLILMVDQLSGLFFDQGPAEFLHVPNLRRLYDQGVNFSNAYCASPLCTPARISFMTGMLPSRTGVYDNAAEFASHIPTFAHYLRSAGYDTCLSGKMHFVGPDQLHGFEQRLTTDIYPADFGWTPNWRRPDERVDWWYHNLGSVTEAGTAETTNQLEFDDEVAYQTKLQLTRLARSERDKPFCLVASFTHPHDPYVARPAFYDLYDEVPPPTVAAIPYEAQDPHSRRLMDTVDWRNYPLTPVDIERARRAYFANVSYLDGLIGEILERLQALSLAENTIILFTSDHGDMLGERGLWFKMSFFEASARVPLLIHAPGRFGNGHMGAPVSTMDILPTLLELAGTQTVGEVDGCSLLPALSGEQLDRPVAGEYAAEGAVAPIVMLREGDWKYIFCEADGGKLFNLADDPHECSPSDDPEMLERFRSMVAERWDLVSFNRDVLASQQSRHVVDRALRQGRYASWDHQPIDPADNRFMRNHLDLNDVEARARFPKS